MSSIRIQEFIVEGGFHCSHFMGLSGEETDWEVCLMHCIIDLLGDWIKPFVKTKSNQLNSKLID